MVELSRYVARLHPAVLTVILVVGMVVQIALSGLHIAPLVRGLLTALPIAATCLWCWSIFGVAKACGTPGAGLTWAWLFAVPPMIPIIATLAGWPMQNSPAALAFFIVFFVALWLAAQALENADALGGQASAGRIVVTMFLMFFALLGVWILTPKIRRLEARRAAFAG
jgi:hypothetical protein